MIKFIVAQLKNLAKRFLFIKRCFSLFSWRGLLFYRDYVHYKGQLSEIGLCGSPRERNLSYQGVKFSYHSSTSDIPLIKNIIVGRYVNGNWQRFHNIDINGGLLGGGRISSLLHNKNKIETLKRDMPFIMIEIWEDNYEEASDLLVNLGYKYEVLDRQRNVNCDYLFYA